MKKEKEIIPLTFDYVFTSIFNNPNNIDIVESFLAAYFNETINNIRGKVKINNRDLIKLNKKDSRKQVDLILDLNGEKINIELNNDLSQGKENRNVVYASKIHGSQLKVGEKNYLKILRTLQINLNNFNSNEKKLRETYYLRNEEGKILSKKFQIDYIDLEKADKNLYNEDEKKLARWCRVIKSKTRENLKKELGEGLMKKETKEKLVEEVEKYTDDEEVFALYSNYTREELERNTIIEEARIAKEEAKVAKAEAKELQKKANEDRKKAKKLQEKANEDRKKAKKLQEEASEYFNKTKEFEKKIKQDVIEQNKIKIAKKMLTKKMDITLISEITELSPEEILDINK